MELFSTGIDAVDQMGKMPMQGNIVPTVWNKTMVNQKGKKNRLANQILADIAYWYRPTEVRDEKGRVVGWKKKFRGDMLQRGYEELVKQFDEKQPAIKRALIFLEELGVVRRVFRTIEIGNGGRKLNNVLYLELNVDRLFQLTYPQKEEPERKENGNSSQEPMEACEIIEVHEEEAANILAELPEAAGNNVGGYEQDCLVVRANLSVGACKSVRTNTNNITDITTENTPEGNHNVCHVILSAESAEVRPRERSEAKMVMSMEEIEATKALIRENLEYDLYRNDERFVDGSVFEDMYHLICDVVCSGKRTEFVNGGEVPMEVVKKHFLRLDSSHVLNVIWKMKSVTEKIKNVRAYAITALYNETSTSNIGYQQAVQNALYGPKKEEGAG